MSRLCAIIGWPVAQSLSPAIHNAAFAALGLDWTYVPLGVRPGALDDGMRLFADLNVAGANVTIPHKQDVIEHLDRLAGDAPAIGAVNTIARDGDALVGYNTDGEGFLRALAEAGWTPHGARAHVIGAGGAARGIAVALADAGCPVKVSARRDRQAAALAELHERIQTAPWAGPVDAELIVQATPLRSGLPLDQVRFVPECVAVDLIYLPPATEFLERAQAAGARAIDGLGMLVHQAALSFQIWTGREAPLGIMRAAARSALEMA